MAKSSKRIAVIGAGPAGLAAAYELALGRQSVTLFEASSEVGGMARSFELWGQIVDVGPHRFFSSDPRVNQFWLDATDGDYVMVDRLTRIYYKRKFFDYPLKAMNALRNLGVWEALLCMLSYLRYRIRPIKDESTFEAWVTNRFGKRLFSIFFKSYTEKLWGISCAELDADFAAQRIKKLDLYEAVKAAIFGGGGKQHKTLVDQFAYPSEGAGQVYENLAHKFVELGGDLKLSTPIQGVNLVDQEHANLEVVCVDGTVHHFDEIVSTMPITHLVRSLNPPHDVMEATKDLKFRNTIIVYLEVDGPSPFPDQWIYVHAPELLSGRITNFANWTPTINRGLNKTILCLEFWCYDEDQLWTADDEDLIQVAKKDLEFTGLIGQSPVTNGRVLRVPKCYPVYGTDYRASLQKVEKYLDGISNLSVIGRYGAFKYNNQDHSILMGLLAAENILNGTAHNLWDINTDYEYQESSRITATGLVQD